MSKMSELVHGELSNKLGPEAQQLCLRIGINSGSVTACVLRGDKGRFQLFGDCMNVASRMESTGQCGRIQISESTKNELVAHGKSAWTTPREDVVHVKGKGDTRTYWLLPTTSTTASSLSSSPTRSTRVKPRKLLTTTAVDEDPSNESSKHPL